MMRCITRTTSVLMSTLITTCHTASLRAESGNPHGTSQMKWIRRIGSSQRCFFGNVGNVEERVRRSEDIVKNTKREKIMVVSYNIFANSLASGTIPWVLSVKRNLRERADEYFSRSKTSSYSSWKDFKKNALTPAYTHHFHKPRERRDLWRQGKLSSSEEIPDSCAEEFEFVDTDMVSYVKSDGSVQCARTLRGTLRQNLPKNLADELFDDIMKNEKDVYSWSCRGRKMLNILTKRPWNLSYGGSGDIQVELTRPDIICLQEYDVHNTRIELNGRTFQEEMRHEGYDGIFLQGPCRHSKSGLSIWWRSDRFDLDMLDEKKEDEEENKDNVNVAYFESQEISPTVQCGDRVYNKNEMKRLAVWNTDMMERWNKKQEKTLMPKSYRRNVALIRLRSRKHVENSLYVGNTHLMTTSRDDVEKGYIRANELRTIKDICVKHCESKKPLILSGDFNTPCSRLDIFSGSSANIKTGFDIDTKSFQWWKQNCLVEAFESHHGYSENDDVVSERCTSKNKNRTEWIDYMFYTPKTIHVVAKTDNFTPAHPIPDASDDYPSDHIPIGVLFELA
jgi:exonuclease III